MASRSERFHIRPEKGWINDPNGPLLWQGKTHIFYQHVGHATHWDWGITWGHAVSDDLVRWRHLPDALFPTKRGADTSGCWSGCAPLDTSGQPRALYTGVRLKGSALDCEQAKEYAAHEPMAETVMLARCEVAPDAESDLIKWSKGEIVIREPPDLGGAVIEGWRDPFVFQRRAPGGAVAYQMILGSGFRDAAGVKHGTILRYSAARLEGPWAYEGQVATGGGSEGRVWECPALLAVLPRGDACPFMPAPGGAPRDFVPSTDSLGPSARHLLIFGAFQSTEQQAAPLPWAWDPVLYYLGGYDGAAMSLAAGSEQLDLGEAPYAATCHIDHANRPVLWVWLRDPRPDTAPALDTCGCLGVPRLLSYVSTPDKEVAFQEPIPELSRLRHERLWSADAGTSVSGVEELPGVEATHIDAQIVVQRGEATHTGIAVLTDEANASLCAVICWDAGELRWLKARGDAVATLRDFATAYEDTDGLSCRGAGPAHLAADARNEMGVRLLVDGSAVELFTSTGQAMSTRVYAGADAVPRVAVVALGGASRVSGDVWSMSSIWDREEL